MHACKSDGALGGDSCLESSSVGAFTWWSQYVCVGGGGGGGI